MATWSASAAPLHPLQDWDASSGHPLVRRVFETHKWTFSPPFPLPNFGRSFIVANDQLATLDIH
jgi:hypothetical protein